MCFKASPLDVPSTTETMVPSIQNCFKLNSELEVLSIDPTDRMGCGLQVQ